MLEERLVACSCGSWFEYRAVLETPPGSTGEWDALAERLTVGETYFFRNPNQLEAVRSLVLPARRREAASAGGLHVLSAGCASGEELYTLAILLREALPEAEAEAARLVGIDLNPAAVRKARMGLYSSWSLRHVNLSSRGRYFRPAGSRHRLIELIRTRARFHEGNLLNCPPPRGDGGKLDLVFCRNVLMYLTPEAAAEVVERLATWLAPGGFLFLGEAETLRGLSTRFRLIHVEGAFFYERLPEGAPTGASELREAKPLRRPASLSWASPPAIRTTAEDPVAVEVPSTGHEFTPQEVPAPAFRETAAGASASPGPGMDPEAGVVRVLELLEQGSCDEAGKVLETVLAIDEFSPAAHYLRALWHEQAGDREAAVAADRRAIYLDPSFAMPHFHLGRILGLEGNRHAAEREFRRALELFARETVARTTCFGGGFDRAALIGLCRAALDGLRGVE